MEPTPTLLGEIYDVAAQDGGVHLTVLKGRPGWRVEIGGYGVEATTLAHALWLTKQRMEQSQDWEVLGLGEEPNPEVTLRINTPT